jgi:putative pyruvate formate lyase activating enzyme
MLGTRTDMAAAQRYTDLAATGELRQRAERLGTHLHSCDLCPHLCHVDRIEGKLGRCKAGAEARIASFGAHFGEEAPLVGQGGSGTVFFSHCTMRCVYCQNWDISQAAEGEEVSEADLADVMVRLQERGCENINLVTPTHYLVPILKALALAAERGLEVPLVYNTSGYERVDILRFLDGVVDVYLPDIKYADAEASRRFSGAADYPEAAFAALREMHRQVGGLQVDERGVAVRGLMVRHLVLPDGLAGTPEVMRFIAEELSLETYVNVMGQYRPEFRAAAFPEIALRLTAEELREAIEIARAAGLTRVVR